MPSGMEKLARRWLAAARCAVPQVHVVYAPAAPTPPGSHRTRSQCDRPGGVTREAPRGGSGVHTPSVHRQPPCPWVSCVSALRRLGAVFRCRATRVWCGLGRTPFNSDPQECVHILWGGASDPQECVHILFGVGPRTPSSFYTSFYLHRGVRVVGP
eukprot:scaffold61528_cov54-Phaeocystis_antarctica.AAC.1